MPPPRERPARWGRYILLGVALAAMLLIHVVFTFTDRPPPIGTPGGNEQTMESDPPIIGLTSALASQMPTRKPLPTIAPEEGIRVPLPSLSCIGSPYIASLTVQKSAVGNVVRHRPQHIQKELDEIAAFGFERYVAMSEKASNSESLTPEDVKRAENNWVEELPSADTRVLKCPSEGEIFAQQRSVDLEALATGMLIYNQLKDTIQRSITDSAPMVVDIGCVVGEIFARNHPTSTVVCIHLSRTFSTKPTFGNPPANLFHLFTQRGEDLLNGDFKQFFDVCNFFTLVFVLGNMRKDLQRSSEVLMDILKKVLPSSALVYTAIDAEALEHFHSSAFTSLPPATKSAAEEEAERIRALDDEVKKPRGQNAKATTPPPPPAVIESLSDRVIASTRTSTGKDLLVLEYVVGKSQRPCRKTWNAPFVQWARSQSVTYDHGKVSFMVKLLHKDGRKVDHKLRYIHPLQYLHSLNLDTLLGAGLSDSVRIRLLGEMIATPRYSDPLPHNWVVASGGKVQRIDKVDAAYDAKVDEAKGYWGRSTRGYLHLLTYHLCLPVNPDGSPSPFLRLEEECLNICKVCLESCSYLPKGSICPDCTKCGNDCIRPIALTLQSAALKLDLEHFAKVSLCQKTYSSMHAARKVWAKWEKEDAAGIGQLGHNGGFAG